MWPHIWSTRLPESHRCRTQATHIPKTLSWASLTWYGALPMVLKNNGGWRPHQVFHIRKEIVESNLDNQLLPVPHTNVLNGERAWLLYALLGTHPWTLGATSYGLCARCTTLWQRLYSPSEGLSLGFWSTWKLPSFKVRTSKPLCCSSPTAPSRTAYRMWCSHDNTSTQKLQMSRGLQHQLH